MRNIIKGVSDAYNKIHKLGVIHLNSSKENISVQNDELIVLAHFDHTVIDSVSERLMVIEDNDVSDLFPVYKANTSWLVVSLANSCSMLPISAVRALSRIPSSTFPCAPSHLRSIERNGICYYI